LQPTTLLLSNSAQRKSPAQLIFLWNSSMLAQLQPGQCGPLQPKLAPRWPSPSSVRSSGRRPSGALPHRSPSVATLPRSNEAESMHRPTISTSPTLAQCLIDSSPCFIAETVRVKLHRWSPASLPLRSPSRPIKGTPSTAAHRHTSCPS
jgi:hypothetical protein